MLHQEMIKHNFLSNSQIKRNCLFKVPIATTLRSPEKENIELNDNHKRKNSYYFKNNLKGMNQNRLYRKKKCSTNSSIKSCSTEGQLLKRQAFYMRFPSISGQKSIILSNKKKNIKSNSKLQNMTFINTKKNIRVPE